MSYAKLIFFLSYQRLKTQKHSVSIGLFCSAFFYEILIESLFMQFFYIQNHKICLIKKIL